MQDFTFSVTEEEQKYLLKLVEQSISSQLNNEQATPASPPTETMSAELGAFVTLKIQNQLRGCIGNVQSEGPLFQTIWNMAQAAAFKDPRFPALSKEEFSQIEIEISVLSPIELCPNPEKIEVGKHGLIMVNGNNSGLLLPQVPVEWQWDRTTFLKQTCQKAHLPTNAWQDENTNIYWFEAIVFS